MKVLLSILLLLGTGCASVARLPSSTGQAPVVGGKSLAGRFGLDLKNTVPVTTINDTATNPPTRREIIVGRDNTVFDLFGITLFSGTSFDAALGIIERLDLYFTNNLGLRFMFWGDPKAEGWRSTFFVGSFNSEATETTTVSTNTNSVKTNLKGIEYGVSVGNKFSDMGLAYFTLASRGGDARITVNQNGTLFSYDDQFEHYLGTFGFMYGKSWYLKLEATANHIDWEGTSSVTNQKMSDSGTEFGGTLGFGYIW